MYQNMVHQCDLRWNQIEASILLMYEKMVDLGLSTKKVLLRSLGSP